MTVGKGISSIPRLLIKILPSRTKRLIFISSFLAHLQNCNKPDSVLLHKLNTLLNLSNDEKALSLPTYLHTTIWGNIDLAKAIHSTDNSIESLDRIAHYSFTGSEIRRISESILNSTPDYLHYDSRTKMRSDLITIFKNINTLIPA